MKQFLANGSLPGGSWAASGHSVDAVLIFNASQLSLTIVLGNVGRSKTGFLKTTKASKTQHSVEGTGAGHPRVHSGSLRGSE